MKKLVLLVSVVFGYGLAYGQFDPNCYYPKIGEEIDTIYGSKNEQQLGSYMMSLPRLKDEEYNRIGVYGLPGHIDKYTTFKTGPGFDLHKLDGIKEFGLPDIGKGAGKIIRYGHFRSPKYRDMIVFNIDTQRDTIYWADDNGEYDSSRYTSLESPITPDSGGLFHFATINPSYIEYFTSDTVMDIVTGGGTGYLDYSKNRSYLFLYKGGEHLYNQGIRAYPDSTLELGNLRSPESSVGIIPGDFRGVGRNDVIIYKQNKQRFSDLFYYKNDLPFSLAKFYNSIRYDTLMTAWENKVFREYQPSFYNTLVMSAYKRSPNDPTVDFMQSIETTDERHNSMWLFKGGPDFGSKRLYLDSPSYFFWHPSHYDNSFPDFMQFFPGIDVGDMTGTGNRVMFAGGVIPFVPFINLAAFYVLGDAMDDKIDIFFSQANHPGFYGDTITVNSDNYQDVILSMSRYVSDEDLDRGKDHVGSIGILKGTTKIPVTLNAVASERERKNLQSAQVYASPNPLDQKTVLTFENCSAGVLQLQVFNSIGVVVQQEEVVDVDGVQQYAVDMSSLAAGVYHIRYRVHETAGQRRRTSSSKPQRKPHGSLT
jgi:hypothetical protein